MSKRASNYFSDEDDPDDPPEVPNDGIFEVEKILDSKYVKKRGKDAKKERQFLM